MVSPDLRQAASVIDLFDRAAEGLRQSPVRRGSIVQLPARGRLIATGDLHDNPMHLQKIVTLARLGQSRDHHVALHELIHGERLVNSMDFSYRVLARVAHLALLHPGQVHPLLANHELAQMSGRSISKGAGDSMKMFNDALDFVFGEDAIEVAEAINRFIAAMPLALRSGEGDQSGVLCAHSLPGSAMMSAFDPAVLERDLMAQDYLPRTGSAHLMVWGRGHTHDQIETLAARWNVKLFILGHEHVETGIEIKGPRLIVLNSDHDRATALPVNLVEVPDDAVEVMMNAVPLSALGDDGPLAA